MRTIVGKVESGRGFSAAGGQTNEYSYQFNPFAIVVLLASDSVDFYVNLSLKQPNGGHRALQGQRKSWLGESVKESKRQQPFRQGFP